MWFINQNFLTFDNLAIGPQSGFQGGKSSGNPANDIVVENCTIGLTASNPQVGINATGNGWTIGNNTVQNIGNSGMLLDGDDYTISGNTITNTGLDSAIGYGMHGIYLKVSNATVTDNTITNFSADGISVRYRNSVISGNKISGGAIGIAWFQYDTAAGTSYWTNNVIVTGTAGIYVSASDVGGPTIESFVISGNILFSPPTSGWVATNLHSTTGSYSVSGNTVQ